MTKLAEKSRHRRLSDFPACLLLTWEADRADQSRSVTVRKGSRHHLAGKVNRRGMVPGSHHLPSITEPLGYDGLHPVRPSAMTARWFGGAQVHHRGTRQDDQRGL